MRKMCQELFVACSVGLFMLAPFLSAQVNLRPTAGVAQNMPGKFIGHEAISEQTCETRANDTPEKLLECIHRQSLWNHLSKFQTISDDNPGPDGHGNRDTGTSGYLASVHYVAKLMRRAGYLVTVQPYQYNFSEVIGEPQFGTGDQTYPAQEWFVARLSAGGTLTAPIQPSGGSGTGCFLGEFAGFLPGNIALLQRGSCSYDAQVENAKLAGASAVILYNNQGSPDAENETLSPAQNGRGNGAAFQARLTRASTLPVVGVVSYAIGADLYRRYVAGNSPSVHLDIRTRRRSGTDYNLIAASPLGNPQQVVVVEAHLDSIFGAGMLDNASGSTTILEIALKMANTPTRNQLRYIWFGGEEIGLLGSAYYTTHLSRKQRRRIVFDIDADVTATPNFDYLIADPAFAYNVDLFPKNVVPESKVGNLFFQDFFDAHGTPLQSAWFGNAGTDSNSFALIGVPDSGMLTEQDCCKEDWEVAIWGGYLGNYEGNVPGYDGGCVDLPGRWCDNLSNNDPAVFELASKAVAYVTSKLANYVFPIGSDPPPRR